MTEDDDWERLAPAWIDAELLSWSITATVVALPVGLGIVWLAGPSWTSVVAGVVAACAMGVLIRVLARPWTRARWRNAGYRLHPDRLAARDGVFWRHEIHVPCSRVQHIDVNQGPLMRRYGLATLVIHTAGSTHARVSVAGLLLADARALRDVLVSDRADDGV